MVVVVADPIFKTSRRPGGLNAPNETFCGHQTERVIDRLERDRANLSSDSRGHAVSRGVRLRSDRPQHGQTLGRHLNSTLTKEVGWVSRHGARIDQLLESFQELSRLGPALRGR